MRVMKVQVCRAGPKVRWVVMLGDPIYGAYVDSKQAPLDAVDAAHDAMQSGRDAQMGVRKGSTRRPRALAHRPHLGRRSFKSRVD